MLESGDVPLKDRPKFLNKLGKMCSELKTIPDSIRIENHPDGPAVEERHGGCATVSRGEYRGRPVAIKTLHQYLTGDPEALFRVSAETSGGSERSMLTTCPPEISQRSRRLEAPTTPKYPTIHWCDPRTTQARNCIRVDGSRQH